MTHSLRLLLLKLLIHSDVMLLSIFFNSFLYIATINPLDSFHKFVTILAHDSFLLNVTIVHFNSF